MGRSVHMPELPRIIQPAPGPDPLDGRAAPHLSLAMEAGRSAVKDTALLAEVARIALTEAGASTVLARRVADAARVATHYVLGHSGAPCVCLVIDADATAVTMAVSDYSPAPGWSAPAWLPVSSDNTLYLDGVRPGTDPLATSSQGDGLQLHRTCDGHVRLGLRTSWQPATTTRTRRTPLVRS